MNFLLPLATESVSARMEFFSNISYQTVGVMIVLTSLCGLAILVALVAWVLLRFTSTKKTPTTIPPQTPATVTSEGVPAEIRAVIAAAIHVTLKSPHRILHVEPVQNLQLHAWSVEGRRQIFQSHTFR